MDQLTTIYQTIQRDVDALDQDRQALDDYLIVIQDHVDEKDTDSAAPRSSTGDISSAPLQTLLSQPLAGPLGSPPETPSFSLSSSAISPFTVQEKSPGSQAQTSTTDDHSRHNHPRLERLWAQSKKSWSVFQSLVVQERSSLQSRRDRLIENQGTLLKTLVDYSTRLAELSKDERIRGLELASEERLRGREIEMEIRLRELQKEEKIQLREIEKEERVRLQALSANTAIKGNISTTVGSNSNMSSSSSSSHTNNVNGMGSGYENMNRESSSKVALPLANTERAALGGQSGPKPAWLVAIEAKEAAAAAAAASSCTGSGMASSGEARPVDSMASSDGERPPRSYLAKEQVASTEVAATIGVAAPDTASNVRSSKKSREGVRAGYANRVDAIINNIR